jgi:signal peptidase II
VIVIVTVMIYYRFLPDGQALTRIALGLQLGGAIGNLVDRLRQGFVVDFIDFNYWPMRNWPVSNVADISIVTGVSLLALLMVWEEYCERKGQQAAAGG